MWNTLCSIFCIRGNWNEGLVTLLLENVIDGSLYYKLRYGAMPGNQEGFQLNSCPVVIILQPASFTITTALALPTGTSKFETKGQ